MVQQRTVQQRVRRRRAEGGKEVEGAARRSATRHPGASERCHSGGLGDHSRPPGLDHSITHGLRRRVSAVETLHAISLRRRTGRAGTAQTAQHSFMYDPCMLVDECVLVCARSRSLSSGERRSSRSSFTRQLARALQCRACQRVTAASHSFDSSQIHLTDRTQRKHC